MIIFLSFPSFSISSLSFFLLFNPNQNLFFIVSSFIKSSFFFYHVFLIRYSFLSSFISLSCLIQFFQVICVFANFSLYSFEISFRCDIVLFSVLLLLILHFHFSKLLFHFFFIPFFLKHAAIPKRDSDKHA